MPTINELAKEYSGRLKATVREQRVAEFRKIESEINTLEYVDSKKSISLEDKLAIYRSIKSEIEEWLKLDTAFASGAGNRVLAESSNDRILELINAIIDKLKG